MVASSQRNFDRKLFRAMNNRSLSGESFEDVDCSDGLTTDVPGGTNHLARARQSYAARISVRVATKRQEQSTVRGRDVFRLRS